MEIYKNLSLEDLEGEVWKDIPNYEGLYQVSNIGRVKSLTTNSIMSQYNNKGYLSISLRRKGNKKGFLVHRLVAECFVAKLPNKRFINHKNEDKHDNRSINLEWCTVYENNNYGLRNQKISKTQTNRSDCSVGILQYSLDGELINEWPSLCELERNGFNRVAISRVCRGIKHYISSGGYTWKYKD